MPENKMIGRACLTFVAYLFCLAAVQGVCASVLSDKINSILTLAGLESADIPGASVLVLKDGEVLFERGYGVTDLKTFHKIDAQTNFRLASVTKQFTAMAVMLLVHDGKLKYDETLTDIFPSFPEYGKAITIRMLLNHTSGLRDYEDLMGPAPPPEALKSAATEADPDTAIEQKQISDGHVLELLEQQKSTKFPPGSKWEYSNSGYVLLGMIIQKISGESFPDFLHDRIFSPLLMKNTVAYLRGKNFIPNRAFGHIFENGMWKQSDQSPTSATLGDGGVYSSLEDLAKWDQALRKHKLLSADEMQAALSPIKVSGVMEPTGTPAQYGFGWFLNPYRGHQRMWHYGETMGFRTTIQRFLDIGMTIVVLSNRADLNPSALALQIADVYLGPR
jgi:CubicO group peptidase (beta-lactamase class C family)